MEFDEENGEEEEEGGDQQDTGGATFPRLRSG
jgi:hypothetical protein